MKTKQVKQGMAAQQLHWHIDSLSLESTSVFKTECFSETGKSCEVRQLKWLLVSAIKREGELHLK